MRLLIQVKPVRDFDPSALPPRFLLHHLALQPPLNQHQLKALIEAAPSCYPPTFNVSKPLTTENMSRKRKNDEELVALPSDSEGEEEEE